MLKVLISGGGTGGHIFPAIAIAEELRKRIPEVKIKFVGAQGKMEMRKVPEAGFEIEGLWISGFYRKSSLKNLLLPFKMLHSIFRCRSIIRSYKPDVVIGVGGYASGPLLLTAGWMGVPTVIQEQNGFPGKTNLYLSNRAKRIFVAFPGMEKYFSKEKLVLAGNPVRQVFLDPLDVEKGRSHFSLSSDKLTVLIFGGSLGARTLNQFMRDQYEAITEMKDVQWIWQIGQYYFEEYSKSETACLDQVKAVEFINDMHAAYSAADVVICRAGALTLAEVAVCGKAAVLVPSPNVAEDHQTKNAMVLVDRKAALMVSDSKAGNELLDEVKLLLRDAELRHQIEKSVKGLAYQDAAGTIVNELIAMLNEDQ